MPFVTGIVVVVFGGLTLWLQDDTFIKMKPTIIYVLFGGALLGGLVFGRSLLGYVFDAVFKPRPTRAGASSPSAGASSSSCSRSLNEIVWRNFSTDAWVTFKVFGIMPLTFVFTLSQMPLINRYTLPEDEAKTVTVRSSLARPAAGRRPRHRRRRHRRHRGGDPPPPWAIPGSAPAATCKLWCGRHRQRRELAAHHRLVHADAHHPRADPVLLPASGSSPAACRSACAPSSPSSSRSAGRCSRTRR